MNLVIFAACVGCKARNGAIIRRVSSLPMPKDEETTDAEKTYDDNYTQQNHYNTEPCLPLVYWLI
jgi:hypothetical protein